MYDFNQNLNFLKIIYTRVSTIKKHIDEYGVSVNRKYVYVYIYIYRYIYIYICIYDKKKSSLFFL